MRRRRRAAWQSFAILSSFDCRSAISTSRSAASSAWRRLFIRVSSTLDTSSSPSFKPSCLDRFRDWYDR